MGTLRERINQIERDRATAEASGLQRQAATEAQGIIGQQFGLAAPRLQETFAATQPIREQFITPGVGAADLQSAYSGALGPDAQQGAFSQYQESPGVQFLRDQGQRGIDQSLSARGVGGGGRLKALSRFNQGLALQDFGNQFNRLGTVADRGVRQADLGISERFGTAAGINELGMQEALSSAALTENLSDIDVNRLMTQLGSQQQFSQATAGGPLGNILKYAAPALGIATQGASLYNQANRWL